MTNTNFYDSLDLKYPEIAISMSNESKKGKFFIPILTPLLDRDMPYIRQDKTLNTSNIKNNIAKSGIDKCYTSNFIELDLPPGIDSTVRGDEFIVIFIGGDINKPTLIGRYTNAKQ